MKQEDVEELIWPKIRDLTSLMVDAIGGSKSKHVAWHNRPYGNRGTIRPSASKMKILLEQHKP